MLRFKKALGETDAYGLFQAAMKKAISIEALKFSTSSQTQTVEMQMKMIELDESNLEDLKELSEIKYFEIPGPKIKVEFAGDDKTELNATNYSIYLLKIANTKKNLLAKVPKGLHTFKSEQEIIDLYKGQLLAAYYAKKFNKRVQNCFEYGRYSVEIPPVIIGIIEFKDTKSNRYFFIEKIIDGPIIKYNNNCGYICELCETKNKLAMVLNKPDEEKYLPYQSVAEIIQAYTHFTYIESKRNFMICDLQGVMANCFSPFCLTKKLSKTQESYDLGMIGICAFFHNHKCGKTCQGIQLIEEKPEKLDSIKEVLDDIKGKKEKRILKISETEFLEKAYTITKTLSVKGFKDLESSE